MQTFRNAKYSTDVRTVSIAEMGPITFESLDLVKARSSDVYTWGNESVAAGPFVNE